jgi:hypothetical protein
MQQLIASMTQLNTLAKSTRFPVTQDAIRAQETLSCDQCIWRESPGENKILYYCLALFLSCPAMLTDIELVCVALAVAYLRMTCFLYFLAMFCIPKFPVDILFRLNWVYA